MLRHKLAVFGVIGEVDLFVGIGLPVVEHHIVVGEQPFDSARSVRFEWGEVAAEGVPVVGVSPLKASLCPVLAQRAGLNTLGGRLDLRGSARSHHRGS